jgi:hypothetical protein
VLTVVPGSTLAALGLAIAASDADRLDAFIAHFFRNVRESAWFHCVILVQPLRNPQGTTP